MKDYKARVYGIIDAIGTLGGAFEIVSWIILLLYGSIRKNLYLFSTVNSLVQCKNNQNHEYKTQEKVLNLNMMIRSRNNQQNNQNTVRSGQNIAGIATRNQRVNTRPKKRII